MEVSDTELEGFVGVEDHLWREEERRNNDAPFIDDDLSSVASSTSDFQMERVHAGGASGDEFEVEYGG
eukprot:CAMPEP_0185727076 /NCGR_PEP_ID=MMETSP1171-20130828/2873_1 /TAXON_ID=374046 /ORGANISM="Helicotheca tamensis, Strain CCMP826" /LENGTH=67 /DNA_ID=CAMNT_0028395573 /DNA_START=434 /DNA_END=637 /DNA_ORIENTATION=+